MIMRRHVETIARGIDPRPYRAGWEPELGWQVDALCAQADPEAFFPSKGGRCHAKEICAQCLVQTECLDYALSHHEQWGIWGGMGERERRELQRRVKASA